MKGRDVWIWMSVSSLLGGGATFVVLGITGAQVPTPISNESVAHAPTAVPCAYTIARVRGFHHVRPVLYSEPMCESPRFQGMRNVVDSLVKRMTADGRVVAASVYVRDFNKAEWTWCNGDERYDPGSMLKLAVLITWLSMIDEDPTLMERRLECPRMRAADGGRTFTAARLMELMMVEADAGATAELSHRLSADRYARTFQDLGLPVPDRDATTYRMNVRDYSVFMKALYNSSYLSPGRSEYAMELMTRSESRSGLVAGLPAGTDVAHGSGETGDRSEKQLHETGVVYMDGYPYLITVMTRGKNAEALANAIAEISRSVHAHMSPA
jgi:beta-lactamase class A